MADRRARPRQATCTVDRPPTRLTDTGTVATRRDYDSDPDRFRVGSRLTAICLRPGISLYDKIAGLLAQRGAQHVLDLGCGEGALGAAVDHLRGQAKPLVVGLDASAITDYLIARFVPAHQAAAGARTLPAPLVLTKRGALVSDSKD
jgi:hypothetical protein